MQPLILVNLLLINYLFSMHGLIIVLLSLFMSLIFFIFILHHWEYVLLALGFNRVAPTNLYGWVNRKGGRWWSNLQKCVVNEGERGEDGVAIYRCTGVRPIDSVHKLSTDLSLKRGGGNYLLTHLLTLNLEYTSRMEGEKWKLYLALEYIAHCKCSHVLHKLLYCNC